MPEGEMNHRRASALVRELRHDWPRLRFDTWPIAQGLQYILVDGETALGPVRVTLRCESEVRSFRAFMAAHPPSSGDQEAPPQPHRKVKQQMPAMSRVVED